MVPILEKETLGENIFQVTLAAPEIARSAQPGQFVIVRLHEKGERIPLSLADFDRDKGTITLIFMTIGKTSLEFATYEAGDEIQNLVGPLGHPTEVKKYGRVICVAGGFGAAPIYTIARAYKEAGNELVIVEGARTESLLLLEDKLAQVSDRLIISTDDGSKGIKGVVTVPVKDELENGGGDLVFAIGPPIMMKFVCLTTEPFGVPTIVSLNPIMVDGTGMCGACRVSVAGQTKFGCIHGPDFDGHQVDWDLFLSRQQTYVDEEKLALEKWECRCAEQVPTA